MIIHKAFPWLLIFHRVMQTLVLNPLLVAHHFFMQFANIIIFEIESTTMRSQTNDIMLFLGLDKREIAIYDLIS